MAAVEVTLSGVLYDKQARTTQQVVLIGEGTLSGVGVGGGPVIPPPQPPGGGGPPPGTGIWPNPPEGQAPIPEHPIVIPPDQPKPPEPIQPPIDWKVIWTPSEGWVVVGVPNVAHPAPSA